MTVRAAVLAALVAACGDNRPPADPLPDAEPVDAPVKLPTSLQLGGPLDDDVLDVEVKGDLVVVAGYRNGILGQENVEPVGNAVGFVDGYELDGRLRWHRELDTSGADTVEAMVITDTELDIVGRTSGAFPGMTNAGGMDAFVARMNLDATDVPAVLMFGDDRPQHPVRIARDSTGALLVVGYDDTFVVGGAVIAAEDPLVARVHTDTTLDFFRRPGTAVEDAYEGLVAPGPAGEVIVGGRATGGADKGAFVRRLDATGAVMWQRILSTSGLDAVSGLALGPDGLVYACGTTSGTVAATNYGEQDAFVVALDPATGETMREMQGGSAKSDFARDVVVAADGTVYVTGETLGQLPGQPAGGTYDVMALRFSPQNEWTGAWQRGTAGDDTGRSLALTATGVVIGGYTSGAIVPGTGHQGRRDGFIFHIASSAFTDVREL